MKVPEYLILWMFALVFSIYPLYNWGWSWRISFVMGVLGFTLGGFVDRAFRVSY